MQVAVRIICLIGPLGRNVGGLQSMRDCMHSYSPAGDIFLCLNKSLSAEVFCNHQISHLNHTRHTDLVLEVTVDIDMFSKYLPIHNKANYQPLTMNKSPVYRIDFSIDLSIPWKIISSFLLFFCTSNNW